MRQKQTRHDRLLPDSARSPDKLQVNQLLNQADGTSIPPYVHCLPDDRLFICGLLFKHAFLRCASWDLSLDEAVKLGVPSQRVDVLLSEISHTWSKSCDQLADGRQSCHYLQSGLQRQHVDYKQGFLLYFAIMEKPQLKGLDDGEFQPSRETENGIKWMHLRMIMGTGNKIKKLHKREAEQ